MNSTPTACTYGVIAAASLFGTYNDYYIHAVRTHKRLRATAIVDPGIDPRALAAMHADGIVGVRLQWFFLNPLPDMGSNDFLRLCRQLRELDMHFHLNINGGRLVEVASRLMDTGVKLVIDHFGWHDPAPRLAAPSYQGMLRLLERGDLWVKMTSGYRHPDEHHPDWSLPAEYAQDLLHRFGAEKLLWGSDTPFIGHEHVRAMTSPSNDSSGACPMRPCAEPSARTATASTSGIDGGRLRLAHRLCLFWSPVVLMSARSFANVLFRGQFTSNAWPLLRRRRPVRHHDHRPGDGLTKKQTRQRQPEKGLK